MMEPRTPIPDRPDTSELPYSYHDPKSVMKVLRYIVERLKEATTYLSVSMMAAWFGVTRAQGDALVDALIAVLGVVAVFLPEAPEVRKKVKAGEKK